MKFNPAECTLNMDSIGEIVIDKNNESKITRIDKQRERVDNYNAVFIKEYLAQLDIQDRKLKNIKKDLNERKENLRARKEELKKILRGLKDFEYSSIE